MALRLNTSAGSGGGRKLRSGDAVVYVVCNDGSSLPATQRAYHPHLEVAKRPAELTVDVEYYLAHQVHPVVSRLCDPIDGTDAARIADCLGIDHSRRQTVDCHEENADGAWLEAPEESAPENYHGCEELKFPCRGCGTEVKVCMVDDSGDGLTLEGKCSGCMLAAGQDSAAGYLRNRLTQAVRRHVQRYYEAWQVCEDPACALRTRQTPVKMFAGQSECPASRRTVLRPEFSERSLYRQLGFYQHCFDRVKVADSQTEAMHSELKGLKCDIDQVLVNSAYAEVSLYKLFERLL